MIHAAKVLTVQSGVSNGETDIAAASGAGDTLTAQHQETAQYVADMILEMHNLAKSARLFTITVPLEYAYYEAFSIANQVVVPPEELERLRQLEKAAMEAERNEPKIA